MLRKDCHKPYWKERFIDGVPPIFAHKVKQELMGKKDSIDYDSLTYGDILSIIKKLGINLCNDEKLLKYQLQHKRKAKYEMGNFCEQYGLPPIAPSRQKGKKHDKSHENYSHKKYKKYKNNFVKPNDFYAKKKHVSKRYDKQRSGKGKCFNCGKPGHFSKDCNQKPGKLKNKFNMLNIDDKEQEELFRILESHNLSDSLEDDFSSSSDSCYQFADNSFNSPNIKIGCRDSYCNVIKSVNTLTNGEENEKLIIQRFNKKKSRDLTINDLQHEINVVKQEISKLKNEFKNIKSDNHSIEQELIVLKIDKNLDKHQSDNEQDEHKDGDESSQQALLSDKGIVDNSQLSLINKLLPPKWFTKVKIVVSHDYHFTVIAMIDSSADMNCIQEGLIPSKYFEKSTERLVSANGFQMKIKYELNNAHVCHDNVCFKISFVLVKNMIDKVILGLPFINVLYPFLVEHDGITTNPFGQKVIFEFASKFEIDTDNALNLIHAKVKHLNFLQQEVRYKKIAEQISDKLLQSKIDNFQKMLIDDVCSDVPNAFWHRKKHIVDLPYVKDFNEKNIPTKARPIQMNAETVEFCKKEISDLLEKKLVRNSKSP